MATLGRLASAAVAVLVITAGAGCRQGGTAEDGEPALGEIPRSPNVTALSLPMDAYLGTPAVRRTVNEARNALFASCMRRFGFQPTPPVLPPALRSNHVGRYGLAVLAEAQQHGYHPASMGRVNPSARSGSAEEASPAARAVAEGTGQRVEGLPAGGCLGEARRKIAAGAPTPPDADIAARLDFQANSQARQDSRVLKVTAAWSACMKRAGYAYADPMAANDDPRFRTDAPSAPEVQVATADVRCKQETNLVGVWVAVESAYQRRAIERNAEPLHAVKALLDTQIRNAAALPDGT
jgi:hypothetical protein